MIIAIDPGVCWRERGDVIDGCALAYFDRQGQVVRVEMSRFKPGFAINRPLVEEVVVERPQYDSRSDAARTQDLIALAWDGALLAASFTAPVTWYTPHQWKGSLHKPQQHAHLWKTLTEAERALLPLNTQNTIHSALERGIKSRWKPGSFRYPASFTTHNILDAIALGKFHLSRKRAGLV
jgi:hypothetical protein